MTEAGEGTWTVDVMASFAFNRVGVLMAGIADRIMDRVHTCQTQVYTPQDFLDFGNRSAVHKVLSRLAQTGQLRRVGHGLYDLPRINSVLKRFGPAHMDAVLDALIRRDRIRIMPDGLTAAHRLGLTNAVPAKVWHLTDKATRTVTLGDGRMIRFQHASPSVMYWAGKLSALAVQALYWFGPHIMTSPQAIAALKRNLPDTAKQDLIKNRHMLPDWTQTFVLSNLNEDRQPKLDPDRMAIAVMSQ